MNKKTRELITYMAVFTFCMFFVSHSASAQNNWSNAMEFAAKNVQPKPEEQTTAWTGSTQVPARPDEASSRGLAGSWRVVILPGTPNQFFSLMKFDEKGTMTDVSSSPGNTASVGVWEKTHGTGNNAAMFELFLDSNNDGAVDLRFRVRLTIHVSDRDTLSGTSTLEVRTLDGGTLVAGPFAGIPLSGSRMKVLSE